MNAYIALLRKEAASDFSVDFPDFPGCITAGLTLEEARRMAVEALNFHIVGLAEDGAPIPVASSLDDVMSDPDNREAVAFLVDTAPSLAEQVQINVVLPVDLLEEIDRQSDDRSRFLAEAARAKLRTEWPA